MAKKQNKGRYFTLEMGATQVIVHIDPTLKEQGLAGCYEHRLGDGHIIKLCPNTPREMGLALIHELVHMVSNVYGLKLGEKKTRVFEQAFGALLLQNEKLSTILKSAR